VVQPGFYGRSRLKYVTTHRAHSYCYDIRTCTCHNCIHTFSIYTKAKLQAQWLAGTTMPREEAQRTAAAGHTKLLRYCYYYTTVAVGPKRHQGLQRARGGDRERHQKDRRPRGDCKRHQRDRRVQRGDRERHRRFQRPKGTRGMQEKPEGPEGTTGGSKRANGGQVGFYEPLPLPRGLPF
jgi:hypothetical protein